MEPISRYRHLSLWLDQIASDDGLQPRPSLDGDRRADVVIVGAGYSGLWTAYYLATQSSGLDIVVIEGEIAGFGASGRNGGWCSGEFAMRPDRVNPRQTARQYRAIWDSIDEVGRVAAQHGIECHYAKGGSVVVATSAPQAVRLRDEIAWFRSLGFDESDHRWLTPTETRERIGVGEIAGAVYTPHCAAIQPAALVRGLARVVEDIGVTIVEGTWATSIEPGVVRTESGNVYGRVVIDCLEAFASQMPGRARERIPVYSLMIATEPVPSSVWERLGLAERETFGDARHNVIYGQRTHDDRLAFGGRGAPYHMRSAMRPEFERQSRIHRVVDETLRWLLPELGEVAITHTWGGAVAIPRDFSASLQWDPATGAGRAGGYVGAGVSASNLAGQTMADLVLGRHTERTTLPWVGHRSRRWEPEPLRWMGVELGRRLAHTADQREFRTGRRSKLAGPIVQKLTGH